MSSFASWRDFLFFRGYWFVLGVAWYLLPSSLFTTTIGSLPHWRTDCTTRTKLRQRSSKPRTSQLGSDTCKCESHRNVRVSICMLVWKDISLLFWGDLRTRCSRTLFTLAVNKTCAIYISYARLTIFENKITGLTTGYKN